MCAPVRGKGGRHVKVARRCGRRSSIVRTPLRVPCPLSTGCSAGTYSPYGATCLGKYCHASCFPSLLIVFATVFATLTSGGAAAPALLDQAARPDRTAPRLRASAAAARRSVRAAAAQPRALATPVTRRRDPARRLRAPVTIIKRPVVVVVLESQFSPSAFPAFILSAACSAGYYSVNGTSCVQCPTGSSATSTASTTCTCNGGYSSSGSGSSLVCTGTHDRKQRSGATPSDRHVLTCGRSTYATGRTQPQPARRARTRNPATPPAPVRSMFSPKGFA